MIKISIQIIIKLFILNNQNLNPMLSAKPIGILTALLLFISFLVISCSDNNQDQKFSSEGCLSIKEDVVFKSNISEINFFMEVSGSMAGYMKPDIPTNFKYIIPDLVERLNNLSELNFYELAQKNLPLNIVKTNNAKDKIAKGNYKFGSTSTLPVMFDSIIVKSGSTKVSILLTDAIYTPGKEDLRKRDQVIPDIRALIQKAQKQSLATSCISLKSQFQDDKVSANSPYYLFIIGSPANINKIIESIHQSVDVHKEKLIDAEVSDIEIGYPENNPYYTMIPYLDNMGVGEPVDCIIYGTQRFLSFQNAEIDTPIDFWIGIDLSKCPEFSTSVQYLKSNLEVVGSGINAVINSQVFLSSDFLKKTADPTDIALAKKCTHFLKVKVSDFSNNISELRISLKRTIPDWIKRNSHNNTNKAEDIRDSTYGFDQIIAGIEDAYKGHQAPYIFRDLIFNFSK